VKDEIIEATKAAVEFEKATRRLFEAETDLITVNADRRRQIEELVFLTRDLTQSDEVRRNAIIQAAGIEEQILQDNIKLQQQRIQLQKDAIENSAEEADTREELRLLAEAEGVLIDLQTASGAKQRELQNRLNEIDNAARAKKNAAIAAETAKQVEAEAERVAKEKEASKQRLEEAAIDEQFMKDMAADTLAFEKEMAERQKAIDDEVTENFLANAEIEAAEAAKLEEEKQRLKVEGLNAANNILADSFAAVAGFAKEGSKAAKAMAVADATRSAIMGAINAYTSTLQIPFGVGAILAPIAAAAALAAGMANVRKIAKGGPEGGSAAVPNVSLARPSGGVSSADLTNADQSIPTEVNIRQDSSQRGAQKSYVVQSEVTAEQDIEKQRQREATL